MAICGEKVSVPRTYFVMVMRNLSYSDFVAAGTRLVLIDVLVPQVQRRSRLDHRAFRRPVTVHGTKSGTTTSDGQRRNRSHARDNNNCFGCFHFWFSLNSF